MLDHALSLIRMGFAVFPCHWPIDGQCSCAKPDCGKIGKHPRVSVYAASTDESLVRAWWAKWPNGNIGIQTAGLVVVDVDPRAGGRESMDRLRAELDSMLFSTPTSLTGGGGEHLLYRSAGLDLGPTRNSFGRELPGLDIRSGSGAYIIGPGSLHVSGRRYVWAHDYAPDEIEMRDFPRELFERLKNKPIAGATRPVKDVEPTQHNQEHQARSSGPGTGHSAHSEDLAPLHRTVREAMIAGLPDEMKSNRPRLLFVLHIVREAVRLHGTGDDAYAVGLGWYNQIRAATPWANRNFISPSTRTRLDPLSPKLWETTWAKHTGLGPGHHIHQIDYDHVIADYQYSSLYVMSGISDQEKAICDFLFYYAREKPNLTAEAIGIDVRTISRQTGIPRSTVYDALKKLEQKGVLVFHGRGLPMRFFVPDSNDPLSDAASSRPSTERRVGLRMVVGLVPNDETPDQLRERVRDRNVVQRYRESVSELDLAIEWIRRNVGADDVSVDLLRTKAERAGYAWDLISANKNRAGVRVRIGPTSVQYWSRPPVEPSVPKPLPAKPRKRETSELVLDAVRVQRMTREDIIRTVHRRSADVKSCLFRLIAAGKIERHGSGKSGDPYTYGAIDNEPNIS